MNANKVAFIIVCWNNEDLVAECIDSILGQTYSNCKIIFVDNASKDDSVKVASSYGGKVKIIQTGSNTGFAKGNNIGIKEALKDEEVGFIALLNSDARIDPEWTSTIVTFASTKPLAGTLQTMTLDYYDHDIIDSTHIFVSHNGQATQGAWRNRYEGELGPRKVFGVNAAACIVTRQFIEAQPFGNEVFDETMFMYLEDVDLAMRVTVMGWDNYLVPGARAYHMGSASSGKNPGFSLYMTFRNNAGVIIKNFPMTLCIKLLLRLPKSDYETFKHLRLLGQKKASWKIYKGRFASLLKLPVYYMKRRRLNKLRQIDSAYLRYLMVRGF